jgi:hypothetical protein
MKPMRDFRRILDHRGREVTDMNAWLRPIVLGIALLAGFAAASARAEISEADREAFRGIVAAQIEAFRNDDGVAAYSYASPTIQGLFPGSDRFMAMVRLGYQPVYRPQSVTFGAATETAAGPELRVFVTGPDGRPWVAVYSFQKQPDGSWKINGCVLLEDPGESV